MVNSLHVALHLNLSHNYWDLGFGVLFLDMIESNQSESGMKLLLLNSLVKGLAGSNRTAKDVKFHLQCTKYVNMPHVEHRECVLFCFSGLQPAKEETQGPGQRASALQDLSLHPSLYWYQITLLDDTDNLHKRLYRVNTLSALSKLEPAHFVYRQVSHNT